MRILIITNVDIIKNTTKTETIIDLRSALNSVNLFL